MNEMKEYEIAKCENDVRIYERQLQKEISDMMPLVLEKYDVELKKVSGIPEVRNPRKKFPWSNTLRYIYYA